MRASPDYKADRSPVRDEFTIDIALVQGGSLVAGTVCAPALHQLHLGHTNAYKLETRASEGTLAFSKMRPLEMRMAPPEGRRAVVSRSQSRRRE